ncbi:MAG: hypothetical protein J6P44_09035 [Bacteroidales bacterium]|nr:hypothetical protein [Bacteroidales bacterium]
MKTFAQNNHITLASDEIYMTSHAIAHSVRDSKVKKGIAVDDQELIDFPVSRLQMQMYYDGENFIYTDMKSKFIIHPNYKFKIKGEQSKIVNFITATKIDGTEFKLRKYIKL